MLRFINPKKTNYYNDTLKSFSEENKLMFVGVIKNFTNKRYKWIADFLFKHRTNLATNPHKAFVSFFSNRETVCQEYGNIPELYNHYTFLQNYNRQKFSNDYCELSSKQYNKIGQQYSDFDSINFINASKKYWDTNNILSINHEYKDKPIYHAEGYKISGYSNYDKFIWVNNGVNNCTLNLSNFAINLGSNESDIISDSEQYEVLHEAGKTSTRVFDYKIQVNHKNFYYFNNLSEWVIYHTKNTLFTGNDQSPFFGSIICYNENNVEIQPTAIKYFPDILINGKIELAKTIITWATTTSGKCSFNPGSVNAVKDDQSRFVFHTCKHMFNDRGDGKLEITKKDNDGNQLYNAIDLDTELNRRHYATVMTEPYFTTKAINNGAVINYKFINSSGVPIKFNNENEYINSPTMYLKIKCNLDVIREIDRILSLEEYNTDIIDTIIIKHPKSCIPLSSAVYYKNFNNGDTIFYRRQDDGVSDLIGESYNNSESKHVPFSIPIFGPNTSKYTNNMMIAGMGLYTDTDVDYLSIYCNNYTPNKPDDEVLLNINYNNTIVGIESNEKFKPMLKLNGINGYVKIRKKNKNFTTIQTNDGQYEVVYNVEFPYCAGSHYERYHMDFSSGYKTTQILYKDTYICAGDYSLNSGSINNTNDRYKIPANDVFTNTILSGSGNDVTTSWYNDGGGALNGRVLKSTINYPGNRCLTSLVPLLLSSEVDSTLGSSLNYQITLLNNTYEDYNLFVMADNRKWIYDNKYTPYINRENPSYIFEIDVSTLYNTLQNQKQYNCIPDVKRWVLAHIKSFAYTTSLGVDVNDALSNSDLNIDIWDNKSLVGSNRLGNWRSITTSKMDSNKVGGQLIIDSLYRYNVGESISGTGFYTFKIGYYNPILSNQFPINFKISDYDNTDQNNYPNTINKVLYDSVHKRSYHVAYIKYLENIDTGKSEGFEMTIKWNPNVDPELDSLGGLQLFHPLNFINKYTNYELNSNQVVSSNLVNKFFDLQKNGILTDKDRYVNNNKMYFRLKINRSKTYPITKIQIDTDDFQFIQEVNAGANNPFKPLGAWDTVFNWSKIEFNEDVKKLGLNYFKLSSL